MEEMKQKREKVKQAVALSYDPEEDAPKVIASGRGVLAERIIERAKEANVAVHHRFQPRQNELHNLSAFW